MLGTWTQPVLTNHGLYIAGPPLVWVLWVLQHPQFLKVWVLAPMVFDKFLTFASIFIEMMQKIVQNQSFLSEK